MSMKIQYDGNGEIVENKPFSMLADDEEEHTPAPQIRIGNQHIGLEIRGDQTVIYDRSKPIRVSSSDWADPREGSVLSTARDNFGPTRDVRDDTIVDIGGQETTAKVAAELGYLKRNGDGSYSDIGGAAQTHPGNIPQQEGQGPDIKINHPPEQQTQLMDSETEAEIESMYQKAGDSMAEGFALDMIKDPANEKAIRSFADHLQVDEGELSAKVQNIVDKFTEQANGYVKAKYGDKIGDPQEVWDWANENYPRQAIEKIMQDHWRGNLASYDALVKDYLANTKPNTLPQGAKVRTAADGTQVVKLPGKPEVSMAVAVTMGWL